MNSVGAIFGSRLDRERTDKQFGANAARVYGRGAGA